MFVVITFFVFTAFLSQRIVENEAWRIDTRFSYKQHFYKQRQVEIGKKSSKS